MSTVSRQDSITYGFRAILRDPAISMVELAWRWTFGVLLLAGFILIELTGPGHLVGAEWQSRDPLRMTVAALRLVHGLGRRPLFFLVGAVITLLWIVLGTVGRTIILRRILQEPYSVRLRNIVVLQAWRAAFLWIGIAGATASFMFCAWVATHSERPDYLIFYVLLVPLLMVIGTFCFVVNWYLSLAMVCSLRNDSSSVAVQRAMVLSGSHPAAVVGISLFFVMLRVLALLIAFVVAVFSALLLTSSPRLLFAALALVSLSYFAWADFLYVCRLTAFISLKSSASQPAIESSVAPMPETNLAPTSNGYH
ncbi:MAG TPA: hypothetical protein VG759_26085 [Candidatus Angelobacter sp.]|jgi:hypothetical protein|nr:hypothetical protein [Candidatus Angelobacter sp.]